MTDIRLINKKTKMGCSTSKCACSFDQSNETVAALKAHLERQSGPFGMHYDSIWKTTLIIIVIEMLLWAAYKGLKWYRKKKAEKKAYRGRAAWDTWLAHSHGQGTPAINPALMGPQAPFTSSSPSAPLLPQESGDPVISGD